MVSLVSSIPLISFAFGSGIKPGNSNSFGNNGGHFDLFNKKGNFIEMSNKIGGSGKWRRHFIDAPNRKEAMEKARRAGGGNPPIADGDHFHARNGKGEKIKGGHYGWKGYKKEKK